ncbi:MAG: hypothetical protein DRO36_04725 [Candidatus Hecatellales archaeon]|nr:MAG: hypothetical protein DRO36_04725 [Candidatus Hecatellales archaeon]
MTKKLIYIRLRRMEDLIRLAALSITPMVQHLALKEDKHIYFVQSTPLLGRPVVYLFEGKENIEKNFIIYNRFNDEIIYSDKLSTDGQSVSIPIIQIEKTNLFEKFFEEKEKKKER